MVVLPVEPRERNRDAGGCVLPSPHCGCHTAGEEIREQLERGRALAAEHGVRTQFGKAESRW